MPDSLAPLTAGNRTCLAISELYLPLKGGHIAVLHELCRRLGRVSVLTGRMRGLPVQETIDGVEVKRINLSRTRFLRPESLALYVNLLAQGASEIRRLRPSIILAARALPEGLIATLLGGIFRVRTAVFAHGEEITPWLGEAPAVQRRRRGTALVKGRLLWRTYRKTNVIVANSRFTHGLLMAGGIPPEKIALVNPGTDPQRFTPMPRDEWRWLRNWVCRARRSS